MIPCTHHYIVPQLLIQKKILIVYYVPGTTVSLPTKLHSSKDNVLFKASYAPSYSTQHIVPFEYLSPYTKL